MCDETKTGRWDTTYMLDLGNITLDPGKSTTTQLHGSSVYVNQNFEFRLFFIIFRHVAQIQVLLTTLHLQILAIIGPRTHRPFGMSF